MNFLSRRLLAIFFSLLCVSCADNHSELEKAMYPDGTPPGVAFEEATADSPVDDEPRNKSGEPFLKELAQVVEASDRILAVEHSYIYDTGDANTTLSPERVYRTVELTAPDKANLAFALGSTDPHVSGWASACIFEPHHRLEFYKGSKRTHTLEICFGCGQLEWSGSQASEPGGVYATLDSFVRRIGMLPERDWVALARTRP